MSGYARALADLNLAEAGGPAAAGRAGETADGGAQRFLDWLSRTPRRWAVVLDGATSPADLDGLWPRGPGQVVVTSGLPAQELTEPGARRTARASPGSAGGRRSATSIPGWSASPTSESRRSTWPGTSRGLPIAIALAAGAIIVSEGTCREYRAEYAERVRAAASALFEAARSRCSPPGRSPSSTRTRWSWRVAWPALAFASMLDTGGIPAAVLTSPAACAYITGQRDACPMEQSLVRSAYDALDRLGLAVVDATSPTRTVGCTRRPVLRPCLPDPGRHRPGGAGGGDRAGRGGPTAGAQADLGQALRDCTASVHAFAGDLLWKPEAHPALVRAGTSLLEAPVLGDAAIRYWQAMSGACGQLLGPGHAQSVLARGQLADAYAAADDRPRRSPRPRRRWRTGADPRARASGDGDGAGQRRPLARGGRPDGRGDRPVRAALGSRERTLGGAHRETLAVRAQLAAAYAAAGRRGDGIRLCEQTRSDAERALGPLDPDTLTAGASLADAYAAAGRRRDAITAYQRALADHERALGAKHQDTLAVRAQLANAYRADGKLKDAIGQYERVLADRSAVLGPDHADTIATRGNLAYAYRSAGRLKNAIPHYERVVADRSRTLGADHRDTIAARAILGGAYQQARRMREAVDAFEQAVADGDRVLGRADVEALTTRFNLAVAYSKAGRLADAVLVLRLTLADCERHLGADHPMTATVTDQLRAATQ